MKLAREIAEIDPKDRVNDTCFEGSDMEEVNELVRKQVCWSRDFRRCERQVAISGVKSYSWIGRLRSLAR